MKAILPTLWVLLLLSILFFPASASAEDQVYIVQPGDTMLIVAHRFGITVTQLAEANGLDWNARLTTGQQLRIPSDAAAASPQSVSAVPTAAPAAAPTAEAAPAPAPTAAPIAAADPAPPPDAVPTVAAAAAPTKMPAPITVSETIRPAVPRSHTVQPDDTIFSIALQYGVSEQAIRTANDLTEKDTIQGGQVLVIPAGRVSPMFGGDINLLEKPSPAPVMEKWIDVDLSHQHLIAYEGDIAVFESTASSGLPYFPTITGTFAIYVKYKATRMEGGAGAYYYNLPNVPWVMYFFKGYGLHGTYWHSDFGKPHSHGCVNLPTNNAKWLYQWAPIGTKVVVHE
jgi:LysM repeat protein